MLEIKNWFFYTPIPPKFENLSLIKKTGLIYMRDFFWTFLLGNWHVYACYCQLIICFDGTIKFTQAQKFSFFFELKIEFITDVKFRLSYWVFWDYWDYWDFLNQKLYLLLKTKKSTFKFQNILNQYSWIQEIRPKRNWILRSNFFKKTFPEFLWFSTKNY